MSYFDMEKFYPVLTNEQSIWLDIPDDEIWDIDISIAMMNLEYLILEESSIRNMIKDLQFDLVVETNVEYYPYSQKWCDPFL